MALKIWQSLGVALLMCCAFRVSVLAAPAAKDTRLPIPPASDQAAAQQEIQQLFLRKYHILNNNTVGPFIQTLWNRFAHAKQYPVRCFVAMELQMQLATRATEANMVLDGAQYLDTHYRVNGYALLVKSARVMIHNIGVTRAQEQTLSQQMLIGAQAAMKEQHYHPAAQLAEISGVAAQRISDQAGFASARKLFFTAGGMAALLANYKAALVKLQTDPSDGSANQAVGLYLLAVGGHAELVRPYLARSDNPKFQKLAKLMSRDLVSLPYVSRFRMGDIFWDLLKKQSNYALAAAFLKRGKHDYDSGTFGTRSTTLELLGSGQYHHAVNLLIHAIRGERRLLQQGWTWCGPNLVSWKAALAQLKKAHKRYKRAMAQITSGHASAAGNAAIGEFLCLVEGRWDKMGLSFLAGGNEPAMARAARLDRANPTTALGRKAVGDAWWALAQQSRGLKKYNLIKRAAHWYKLAKPKLPAADRTVVTFRILHYKPGQF